jgi:UDP-N-acetylmuramoyl-tripeptide--D-alanyl-D-alanine ligase
VAILHADNPLVMGQAGRTTAPIMTFGESPDADVRASDISLDALARPRFTLHWQGQAVPVQLTLSGEHQVANALAATAFALAAGIGLADIVAVLESYESASKWRMEVTERPDGVTIVNDAYNANPESVRAALKALVAMGRPADGGSPRRTWAVLGEMRELGDISVEEHDAIGRLAVRLDVSKLVAVGEGARPVHLGAAHEGSWGEESTWVPDPQAAIDLLRDQVRPGDIVLVKASRSVELEAVAQALVEQGGGA